MQDIDELIRQALCDDDTKWFDDLDEQSLREMVIDSFRGKLRWLVILVHVALTIGVLAAIICGVLFCRATEVRPMMAYGLGFLTAVLAVSMLKNWYWMELNRNAMIREMKRIELQLARLCARSKGK